MMGQQRLKSEKMQQGQKTVKNGEKDLIFLKL